MYTLTEKKNNRQDTRARIEYLQPFCVNQYFLSFTFSVAPSSARESGNENERNQQEGAKVYH